MPRNADLIKRLLITLIGYNRRKFRLRCILVSDVPKTHPRYLSLTLRDKIVAGVEQGITSIHGLIAHGRGEAFDYLIGETTQPFAIEAIHAAAVMLLSAEHPVISVNGNVAALAPDALIELGRVLNAPLEVNIFHTETGRERKDPRPLAQTRRTRCADAYNRGATLLYRLQSEVCASRWHL